MGTAAIPCEHGARNTRRRTFAVLCALLLSRDGMSVPDFYYSLSTVNCLLYCLLPVFIFAPFIASQSPSSYSHPRGLCLPTTAFFQNPTLPSSPSTSRLSFPLPALSSALPPQLSHHIHLPQNQTKLTLSRRHTCGDCKPSANAPWMDALRLPLSIQRRRSRSWHRHPPRPVWGCT